MRVQATGWGRAGAREPRRSRPCAIRRRRSVASHKAQFALRERVPLQPFSTLGVGGPARWFARTDTREDVAAIPQWCVDHDLPLFVLGGGSNIVVADEGFNGFVMQMAVMGMSLTAASADTLGAAGAGESWDRLVGVAVG